MVIGIGSGIGREDAEGPALPSLSVALSAVQGAIEVLAGVSALTAPVLFTVGTPWSRMSERSVRPVVATSGRVG